MAGWIFVLTLVIAVAAVYRPFGDHMYRVVTGTRHAKVERGIYRIVGVSPAAGQTWGVYARSVLAFSAVSILFLYLFLRVQD
jgi:K+-transporting ATPase ATPase A chain